jgi:hypothetical protein
MKYIITESQEENLINRYFEMYIGSGCVTIKRTANYIVVDVQSPGYFIEHGFGGNEPVKLKNILRKNDFVSLGVGEYAKKIS